MVVPDFAREVAVNRINQEGPSTSFTSVSSGPLLISNAQACRHPLTALAGQLTSTFVDPD